MSQNYESVKNAMQAGTPLELICATCPWDRLCIAPPSMSSAEVKEKLAEAEAQDNAQAASQGSTGMPMVSILTALTLGGRDTMAEICPVFATRLRSREGRQLADGIRSTMQAFADEPDRRVES